MPAPPFNMSGDIKLILALISRIGNSLPCNSGKKLESVETDPTVQQSVIALIELSKFKIAEVLQNLSSLLESVSKSSSMVLDDYIPMEILQSQLFLLKILSRAVTVYWKYSLGYSDVTADSVVDKDGSDQLFGKLKTITSWVDPPPLDDQSAKYLLNVMQRFLIQANSQDEDPLSHAAGHNTNPMTAPNITNGNVIWNNSTKAVISEQYHDAGRVIFFLSAANWPIVFGRLKNRFNYLSSTSDEWPETAETRIVECADLNQRRLAMVIQELNSTFLHLKKYAQQVVAVSLRKAIWNWIETHPQEFVALYQSQRRLEGGPEILFDISNSLADNPRRRSCFWPLQTMLLILCPDILMSAAISDGRVSTMSKKALFLEQLRKAINGNRIADVAAICYVDLCKATTYVSGVDSSPLKILIPDIEEEMKSKLFDPSKPFSFFTENISETKLMTDCLVALYRLNPHDASRTVIPVCLADASPRSWRSVLVKACFNLVTTELALPWHPTIAELYPIIAAPLRKLFQNNLASAKADRENNAIASRKPQNDKKLRKQQEETSERFEMLHDMLRLYRAHPMLAVVNATSGIDDQRHIIYAITSCLNDPNFVIRNEATETLKQLHAPMYIEKWGPADMVMSTFWRVSSQVLLAVARQILDFKEREDGIKQMLKFLQELLIRRNLFLSTRRETTVGINIPERLPANVALEICFLVMLCSYDLDIVTASMKCFGHLCAEAQLTDDTEDPQHSLLTIVENMSVYLDLSSTSFVPNGKIAQQKRIRKVLRLMNRPTPGNLAAWEEVFKRWKVLTKVIRRPQEERAFDAAEARRRNPFTDKLTSSGTTSSHTATMTTTTAAPMDIFDKDDPLAAEWSNYTGFLCSLGGCCASDAPETATSRSFNNSSPRIGGTNEPAQMVERFVQDMLHLVISDNVGIREAIKDILGNDLNPRLYILLFRGLESFIKEVFDANGDITCQDRYTVFIEQTISVLKLILDRMQVASDNVFTVDFGAIVLTYAKYLHRLGNGHVALRIKVKMCQLCEVLMAKREYVTLRQEIKLRNHLLEIIIDWTSDSAMRGLEGNQGAMEDSNSMSEKLHRDLDLACLKTIVSLLHHLPLQPSDSVHESDLAQQKSSLFYKYFSFFLKLLNRCRVLEAVETGTVSSRSNNPDLMLLLSKSKEYVKDLGPLKDHTILALSNLLSANVDAGLKYSLSMGYHEDNKTRTAFMQVLTNILNQGTEFEGLAENATYDRYEKLVELTLDPNMTLAMMLCDVCPVTEIDDVATTLLNIFMTQNREVQLLKAVIEREVGNTDSESELFRRNSMATRLLAVFGKKYGMEYLRSTLQPLIQELIKKPAEFTFELDPNRMAPGENQEQNMQNVKFMTQAFIDVITSSIPNMPLRLRSICAHISATVGERFPDAKYTAVGSFIFLRFFCPALVAPESEVGIKMTTSKSARRGLVLFAKIIQNLANNILFGSKEPYMHPLNDFLTSNIYKVTSFLRDISTEVVSSEAEDMPRAITDYDRKSLHRHLADNLERIGKELTTRKQGKYASMPSEKSNESAQAKKSYDKLSTLLAQLGPAPEIKEEQAKVSDVARFQSTHHLFKEFMRRNASRSTESIASKNIFYEGGVSKEKRRVFYFCAKNLMADSVDFDLLIYHVLKTLEGAIGKPYDILADMTQFGHANEVPNQWAQQFMQIFPVDAITNLSTLYVYNPNTQFRKYSKNLARLGQNKHSAMRTIFTTTLGELHEHISPSEVRLPKSTMALDTDSSVIYHPVTRINNYRLQIPVTLRVSKDTVQITTSRKQDMPGGHSTILNDVYHISEVEAASMQSYRSDDNEFLIKYDRGRSSIVLTSPRKDMILQSLRTSKARFQLSKPSTITERVIRPNDVPGTLLNMALLNLGSNDHSLRLAAYNLLCSLSMTFNFEVGSSLVGARGLCIPSNDAVFVANLSEKLAAKEPSLTLEFLSEFFVGFNKCTAVQKQHCLQYLAPWLSNLAAYCRYGDDHEQSMLKSQEIIRSLIELTYNEVELTAAVQLHIWTPLAKVDEMLNLLVDEFVAYGVEHGLGSPQSEAAAAAMVTLSTTSLRGKIIARLRKIIARTSLKPSRTLTETSAWPEIASVIRYSLMLSFESEQQMEYLPELFHCVSMLVATGSPLIRASVHGLVINIIQNLCTTVPDLDENNLKQLNLMLTDFSEPKYRLLFGMNRTAGNAFVISNESLSDVAEAMPLSSLETIVNSLLEVMTIGAAHVDKSNSWRARWMGLITSTAFQFNPAIQPRAFVTLGCLAKEEVDDDLLYQILVALRGALAMFSENDCSLIVSIVMCLTNIVESLPADSRYLQQMFWLAMSLVQIGHIPLFPSAINLLQVVLRALDANAFFVNQDITEVLLLAREPLLEVSQQIDAATGIQFETHFSFAVAGTLLKGLRHPATKTSTTAVLMSFLEIASKSVHAANMGRTEIVDASILGYLAALLPISAKNAEMRELLWQAGIDDVEVDNTELGNTYYKIFDNLDIPDNTTALLLVSLMVTMLQYAENEPETLLLYGFLAEAAVAIPEVFALVYETLLPKMNQIISSSSNIPVLEAVQSIMYTVVSEPLFANASQSNRNQLAYLQELNFAGLMDCGSFQSVRQAQMTRNAGLASQLVERIVL